MPTRISNDQQFATYINVFHCRPEKQSDLAAALRAETVDVIQHIDGFVSANIHCSKDGRRVTNYAQWSDLGGFQQHVRSPLGQQMIAQIREFADDVDIHVYDVDWTTSVETAVRS